MPRSVSTKRKEPELYIFRSTHAPISVDRPSELQLHQLEVLPAVDVDQLVVRPALHNLPALDHANLVRVSAVEKTKKTPPPSEGRDREGSCFVKIWFGLDTSTGSKTRQRQAPSVPNRPQTQTDGYLTHLSCLSVEERRSHQVMGQPARGRYTSVPSSASQV